MEALRSWGYAPVNVYARAGYTPGLKAVKAALGGRKRSAPKSVSGKPSRYPRRASNLGNPVRRWLWLTIALVALLWLFCVRIPLWRARGRAVVCNRYLLDCLVDFRVNFPDDRVERWLLFRLLRRFAARPDAAFCIVIPPEETMQRARAKARFHWETLDVLQHRWREYTALAQELGVEILDGMRPIDELAQCIQRGVAGNLRGIELQHSRSQ